MSFLLRGKPDRAGRAPRTLTELFVVGELIFDGIAKLSDQNDYARVRVRRLIPRFDMTLPDDDSDLLPAEPQPQPQ